MGNSVFANNKRIAKNTILLYFRMLIMMLIGLFTSRVTFRALGASDLGIANVVGGLVAMFTFLNGTLAGATQRFITYALGENNTQKIQDTFSTAVLLHGIFAISIMLIIEIGGLWMLYHKLNIPEGRMTAAFWMFQFSTLSCGISVIQVPYNASIIAHERMGAFAYLSILDVITKLAIVSAVWFYNGDKLILYGFLWLCAGILSNLLYRVYCVRFFDECHYKPVHDKSLLKEMLSFSGWDTIANLALTLGGQGVNVLFNMFYGTLVNAANSICQQVSGAIMQFASNFQTASRPQIVKMYASHEWLQMYNLAKNTAIFSAYIIMFFIIPIWIKIDYILYLWLGDGVPEYAGQFIRVVLLQNIIYTMGRPLVACVTASGKIKIPNIVNGLVLLSVFPISYFLLKLGFSPVVVYVFNAMPWLFHIVFESFYVRYLVGFGGWDFLHIVGKVVLIFLICFIPTYLLSKTISNELICTIFVGLFSTALLAFVIYNWGVNSAVRALVKDKLKGFLNCGLSGRK